MKAMLSILCCLMVVASAPAACNVNAPVQGSGRTGSLDTRWGPDVFGYVAKNHLEAGGPAIAWLDISGYGTEVTGLSDDNFVGPFPIGWNFHYYWYDVSQFWIGSNGYIKFSTAGQLAQPIPQFPNPTTPNDVIGPYVADWFFGAPDPSACYRWSNSQDTLIVMWQNVTAWADGGNVGSHNFELVLSGVDSSFTFYYGTQTGVVSNNNIAIGMENLTGLIGISCYFGTYPVAPGAIRFYYPDTVNYVVHDMATAAVQNAISGGIFLRVGDPLVPWMSVRNAGNQVEPACSVNYAVRTMTNVLVAQHDTALVNLQPSALIPMQFAPLWTPTAAGLYRIVGTVRLTGDMNAANNVIRTELHTLTLPGELAYDDGMPDRPWTWAGGDGGMGNQFEPPFYPITVTQVSFYVETTAPAGFDAQIIDDDGENGGPGTILFSQLVASPDAGTWNDVQVPEGEVVIEDGNFYVAWMQWSVDVSFGIDTTAANGFSRRAWEYAGGWAENRLAQEADLMIRCTVDYVGPQPPGPFARRLPQDNDTLEDPLVTFRWTRSIDPNGDAVHYLLRVWSTDYAVWGDSTFVTADTARQIEIPVPVRHLDEIVNFYWTVRAVAMGDTVPATNGQGHFFFDVPERVFDSEASAAVTDFALSSHPNPFNPVTDLAFDIPRRSHVELRVLDLLGREIAVLVRGTVEAGRYHAVWDASLHPSGTYFAVLSAGETTRIHKLLLLK